MTAEISSKERAFALAQDRADRTRQLQVVLECPGSGVGRPRVYRVRTDDGRDSWPDEWYAVGFARPAMTEEVAS